MNTNYVLRSSYTRMAGKRTRGATPLAAHHLFIYLFILSYKRGPAVAGPQDRILHSVCVRDYNIIYIKYLQ